MFGGVFVRRRVTAADVAAGHAETQVQPRVTGAQAVFAAVGARCYFFNLIEVRAFVGHMVLLIGSADVPSALECVKRKTVIVRETSAA